MPTSSATQETNNMITRIIVVALAISLTASCTRKVAVPLTAEVNVVDEDKSKTIELRSIGYGKNVEQAVSDAEKKAFEILFFRGIPNTSIDNPLVGINEKEIMSNHPSYFKKFFGGRYESFIMSSYESSPSQRKKGVTSVVNDVKINTLSLRKDLENNNIIRKFGF